MKPLLEVKNLTVAFRSKPSHPVVSQVAFQLDAGQTLGIVGESGSGKSMACPAVLRLVQNASVTGEVFFKDQDLLKGTLVQIRAVRGAQIAMIFQEPMTALNPTLKVGKQIMEVFRLHCGLDFTSAR